MQMPFLVIFVAKIDYNAYQAGIKDIFNAQAGTTFLQDCSSHNYLHLIILGAIQKAESINIELWFHYVYPQYLPNILHGNV